MYRAIIWIMILPILNCVWIYIYYIGNKLRKTDREDLFGIATSAEVFSTIMLVCTSITWVSLCLFILDELPKIL